VIVISTSDSVWGTNFIHVWRCKQNMQRTKNGIFPSTFFSRETNGICNLNAYIWPSTHSDLCWRWHILLYAIAIAHIEVVGMLIGIVFTWTNNILSSIFSSNPIYCIRQSSCLLIFFLKKSVVAIQDDRTYGVEPWKDSRYGEEFNNYTLLILLPVIDVVI
jgi:hypothetical protein